MSVDEFTLGALSALDGFRAELVADRGRIENELEPAVDVVLDLLNLTIGALLAKAGLEEAGLVE